MGHKAKLKRQRRDEAKTIFEWAEIFIKQRPLHADYQLFNQAVDNIVVRTNIHTGAFKTYLERKERRGLVKPYSGVEALQAFSMVAQD